MPELENQEENRISTDLFTGFSEMLGQDQLKAYFRKVAREKTFSNTYLISGGRGSGKKMLSDIFAATLLCEAGGEEACGVCPACQKFKHHNHPDYIEITHEKPNRYSIDEIRTQFLEKVGYTPVEGAYRIFVLEDVDLIDVQGQNAILKSIEEPPEKTIILMLTENPDALLPTILSRVVHIEMKPIQTKLVEQHLVDALGVDSYEAEIIARVAQGNVGQAELLASSDEFRELRSYTIELIDRIQTQPLYMNNAELDAMEKNGIMNHLPEFLNLTLIWYRDVLLYKATGESQYLISTGEVSMIQRQAKKLDYYQMNQVIDEIEATKSRLRTNMKKETALNLLFLKIRGE